MAPPAERLAAWGSFRNGLSTTAEHLQFTATAKFWAQCPFKKWVIHPEDSKNWPTVWELINEGEYCKNAIALGIESTLRLSGVSSERLKLVMTRNLVDHEEYFVVIIDDIHVLNYSYGETIQVDELITNVELLYAYGWKNRTYYRIA
jgi:hypothetical protein